MSTKTIVFSAVLLAAGVVLYRAGGRAPDADAADAQPTARAALLAMPHRLERGVGMLVARAASPTVEGMLGDTEGKLAEMQASLKGVKRSRIETKKTGETVKAVMQLDSIARVQLADGHPIAAFKFAMQSNGLITAVRDNMKREVIR